MFVFSITSKKIKVISVLCAVIAAGLGVLSYVFYKCAQQPISNDKLELTVNNSAEDMAGILKFISNYGYSVLNEPDEIKEIVIPYEFNDVYLNYNEIQKSQGYDLTEYAGKCVKQWTFTVTDYPDFENTEYIKINILIYQGQVIGGDVCSVKSDGFMHGFSKENNK